MTEELTKKSGQFLDELNELRKIDNLLADEDYGDSVNVIFKQHHGEVSEYGYISVDNRHIDKFVALLREIIEGVKKELQEL